MPKCVEAGYYAGLGQAVAEGQVGLHVGHSRERLQHLTICAEARRAALRRSGCANMLPALWQGRAESEAVCTLALGLQPMR
jgi:hypothetical protein